VQILRLQRVPFHQQPADWAVREQPLIQETQLVVLELEPLQFLALQLPYFSQLVVREEQVPEFWQGD